VPRPPISPDQLRLGLILPTWTESDLHYADVLAVARAAAEAGFNGFYAADHLQLPSNNAELKRRAGVDFADDPSVPIEGYLEAFTVLTAIAAAIPEVTVAPFVACAGYRNPGLLAKMAATIDDISGGRFILGLGAGDSEGEHHTFGFPYDRPVGRFEETLQILRRLFAMEVVDHHGEFFKLEQATLLPPVTRPGGPPILIGTLNPKARMRRLVVQYADIWNGWLGYTDASPESAETQLGIIDEACREHGRDPLTLVATTAVRCNIPGSGYTPRPDENPLSGSADEMARTLRGHATLGISEVQVALTMGGVAGVEAFAPVIEKLRG
jgi:alkanesulfonate monooxygenase SsuD/methylene tetrahydromethanopterin reductase-like flavin-dependent oxidoreductase (luciferase family)